jgi:FMN-dependent oxidoreductase (nitrilotriacetate monooxygenase family)
MNKYMHLSGFMIHCAAPHTQMSWIHDKKKAKHQWHEPGYWQSIGKTLERGKFDMLFFADQMAAYDLYKDTMEPTLEYAVQFPVHDPVVLVPAISAVTEKLGFTLTMSTTFYPPYLLARKLSTLDHVTQGRIGWNIVSSFHRNEMRNFGIDEIIPHAERYARAEEYIEVCKALWGSWDADAVVMDMETGRFADPSKVRKIDFKGKWYNCSGPASVIPSPQGTPFLVQAGASEAGLNFAAQHAEAVFGLRLEAESMRTFADDLGKRTLKFDRKPEDIKIMWGIIPIVAKTEAEAKDKERMILERIPIEASLTLISAHFGIDFSKYDIDAPLDTLEAPAIQGIIGAFKAVPGQKFTLREAAIRHGTGVSMPHLVGTPSQVADQMIAFLKDGGGDGFQMSPGYYAPDYFEDIVDLLIPELQERGVFRKEYTGNTLRDHMAQRSG